MTHDPAAVCTGRIRDCAIDDGRGRGVLTIDPAAPGSRAIRDDAVVDGRRGGVQVDPAAIDAGPGITVPDGEALEPGVHALAALEVDTPSRALAVDYSDIRAVGGPDRYRHSVEVKALVSASRIGPVGHEHSVTVSGRIDRGLDGAIGPGDIMGAPGRSSDELIGSHVDPPRLRTGIPVYVVERSICGRAGIDAGGGARSEMIVGSAGEEGISVDISDPGIAAFDIGVCDRCAARRRDLIALVAPHDAVRHRRIAAHHLDTVATVFRTIILIVGNGAVRDLHSRIGCEYPVVEIFCNRAVREYDGAGIIAGDPAAPHIRLVACDDAVIESR